MKTFFVGISAKQGGGKSTLAKAICLHFLNAKRKIAAREVAFATPLKEMHDACRGILKRYGVTPPHEIKDGYLMQLLGTQWGREKVYPDVWVNCAQGLIKEEALKCSWADVFIPVISDLRFPNELAFLKAQNSLTIRLQCREDIRKARAEMWRETTTHESEISLDQQALDGSFNLVLDTGINPVEAVVGLTLQMIEKKLEKLV